MRQNRDKIRILQFISGGAIGGKERAQYLLLRAFKGDPDFEMTAAFSNESGHFIDKVRQLGISVIDLRILSGLNFFFRPRIIQKFRSFDVHHLHDPAPNISVYSLLAGSKIKRIFTRRGGLVDFSILNWKKKVKFQLNKRLMPLFSGYAANSRNAVRSLNEQYGVDRSKIQLLYNGLDGEMLKASMDRRQARRQLGIEGDEFIVGTACHLIRWKRVDLLLRAFAASRFPKRRLFIFGRGPLEPDLRRLAQGLQLSNRVVFAGEVSPLSDRLIAMDCFVLASSAVESFGNAAVEAMYLGVPVIVMQDGGGLLEHVENEKTGYIAQNEGDLADRLDSIALDPRNAQSVAKQGAAYVRETYSLEKMVSDHKEFYWRILGD